MREVSIIKKKNLKRKKLLIIIDQFILSFKKKKLKKIVQKRSGIWCACFDSTGDHIYAGTSKSRIWYFSIKGGHPIDHEIGEEFGEIVGIDISKENNLLAIAGRRGEIRIYDSNNLENSICEVNSKKNRKFFICFF